MGTPPVTVYGIPNCDSVKKTRVRLQEMGVAYAFHDYKKQGVPAARLAHWIEQVGWERLLNRQGTTWRKLDEQVRAAVVDARSAQAVMLAHASVIKRPVVERGGEVICVGFDPTAL